MGKPPAQRPPVADPAGPSAVGAFPAALDDLAAASPRTAAIGAEAGTAPTAPASRVLHSRLIHSKPGPSRAAPPMEPRNRRIATPGRKTPPGLLLSKRRMEAPPSTLEAEPMEAVGVLNRPGGVLFLPAPGGPPAMCRLQAVQLRLQAHRILRQRRDSPAHRHPSSLTVPNLVRQDAQRRRERRSTPPHPGPAPQVQGPRAEALRPSPV